MGPHSNVNLPRRTRADLVAAARAGVRPEDLPEYEADRRKKLTTEPHPLTAPVERVKGGHHRVEIDVAHFTVLQTLATLALRWHQRLEASGLPATQPNEWRIFAETAQMFQTIERHVGQWSPGEAAAVLDLVRMRADLADDGG